MLYHFVFGLILNITTYFTFRGHTVLNDISKIIQDCVTAWVWKAPSFAWYHTICRYSPGETQENHKWNFSIKSFNSTKIRTQKSPNILY